jgi:glycosyltransferase family protein
MSMKGIKKFLLRRFGQLVTAFCFNKEKKQRARDYFDDQIIDLYRDEIQGFIDAYPKVNDEEVTIDNIIENKLSISRFGDGEFKLIVGEIHKSFQDVDQELNSRMLEVLNSKDPRVLVGINNVLDAQKIGRVWSKFIIRIGPEVLGLLDHGRVYDSSEIFRKFPNSSEEAFLERIRKIKTIWKNRKIVFVVGKNSRFFLEEELFDNVQSIDYVYAPARNAFHEYESILTQAKEFDPKEYLIFVVLGPTATVMSYDLALSGYQAIDFGQMPSVYRRAKQRVFGQPDIDLTERLG